MSPEIAKDLVKTRKAEREMHLTLKSYIAQTKSQLESQLKSITEPLRKLLHAVDPTQSETEIKTELPIKKYLFGSPSKLEYRFSPLIKQ